MNLWPAIRRLGRPFGRSWGYVSIGCGYITRENANRLASMAKAAESDVRPILSLKGLSPEARQDALTRWPAPYALNLGEMTRDERGAHLTMVSDYNLARH